MICALWLLCIVYRCSLTHTHRHHITHKHMWRATRQMGPGDRMHFKCSPQTHHTQIIIGMQHKSDWILMGRTSKEALGDGIFHSAACQNEVFLLCFSFFFSSKNNLLMFWRLPLYRHDESAAEDALGIFFDGSIYIYRQNISKFWRNALIDHHHQQYSTASIAIYVYFEANQILLLDTKIVMVNHILRPCEPVWQIECSLYDGGCGSRTPTKSAECISNSRLTRSCAPSSVTGNTGRVYTHKQHR